MPFVFCLWPSATLAASQATADVIGLSIAEVRVEQEGRAVTDRLILGLVETAAGEPLSMRDVRQTIDHLYGLGRFDDIQVTAEKSGAGVIVTYVLMPRHPVQQVEFRGTLGLDEDDLRQAMTERFGALPAGSRAADIARTLAALYRDRGYGQARVTPRVEEFHDPDRSTLIFTIDAGPRATIRAIEVDGLDQTEHAALLNDVEVRLGDPYDSAAIQRRLERYQNDLRAQGYYEARATHRAEFSERGEATLSIAVNRGPHVRIAFAGDPLPDGVRDELVPVRREGSVDTDLLEDAGRSIEEYLHARGFRDAQAAYRPEQTGEELVITYHVSRGPRHILEAVELKGRSGIAQAELLELLRMKTGEPFVQATLDAGVAAVRQAYRSRGFTRATVEPVVSMLPRPVGSGPDDRRVQVTLNIVEGPRSLVGAIIITGNMALTEGQIRGVMTTAPGRPYSALDVAGDRERITLEYLNRGYQSAVVDPHVVLTDGDTRADARFAISEGPQVLVDHVIIVGNHRTRTETIERELLLRPGSPLGYAARLESQQRLTALGLFRRVRISELRHGSEPRRDLLVEVEEAPPTSVGYGGGVEVVNRTRPTGPAGQAEERFELAPRGFFEVGRRNLFGKNRSINLFSRVALRVRDPGAPAGETQETAADATEQKPQSGYGFNEYRLLGTYREPKIFNTAADIGVTGILDQAIRTSFNFVTREARTDVGVRLSPRYAVAGRYSYKHTRLFDEHFTEDEKPLIDRLFPQVQLSKFSISFYRDTRPDPIDPDRGTFLSAENDLAARAVGSEVGFAKTFLEGLTFHRLPGERRVVLALAGRLGMAHGFPRSVPHLMSDGSPELGPDGRPLIDIVEDLPASERFFAGGDTTVRGFSLDRLGNKRTITPSGFPRGGNGLVVLNAEMRVAVWRALTAVGFLDAGNVFPKASDLDLTDLRGAAGFGIRYASRVGPIRIDLGFNLDPRELVPGTLERRSVLHVTLGQAF